jgi:hypothetical protein
MNTHPKSADELAALGITVREGRYRTTYTGSLASLLAAEVAHADQFPDDGKTMKSGGYQGSYANPGQRWKAAPR